MCGMAGEALAFAALHSVEGTQVALNPPLSTRWGFATVRVPLHKAAGADVGPMVGGACLMELEAWQLPLPVCAPRSFVPAHHCMAGRATPNTAKLQPWMSWKHLLGLCMCAGVVLLHSMLLERCATCTRWGSMLLSLTGLPLCACLTSEPGMHPARPSSFSQSPCANMSSAQEID